MRVIFHDKANRAPRTRNTATELPARFERTSVKALRAPVASVTVPKMADTLPPDCGPSAAAQAASNTTHAAKRKEFPATDTNCDFKDKS